MISSYIRKSDGLYLIVSAAHKSLLHLQQSFFVITSIHTNEKVTLWIIKFTRDKFFVSIFKHATDVFFFAFLLCGCHGDMLVVSCIVEDCARWKNQLRKVCYHHGMGELVLTQKQEVLRSFGGCSYLGEQITNRKDLGWWIWCW